MKTASAKAKGRRLQNSVAEDIRTLPGLLDGDVVPAIMGQSGNDITLSPGVQDIFPFAVECKNQESLNIWAAMKQAEGNAPEGLTPLVVFTRNGDRTYAVQSWGNVLSTYSDIADMQIKIEELEQEWADAEQEGQRLGHLLDDAEYERDEAESRATVLEDDLDALQAQFDARTDDDE